MSTELTAKGKRATHGGTLTNPAEYRTWCAIKNRCHNKNSEDYASYGAKGIKVSDEWVSNFAAFLDYMGKKPSARHSIDRYPNKNGNYEPGNVRWATNEEQGNNKNNNILVAYNDKTQTVAEWAKEFGIKYSLLKQRVKNGMPFDKAIEIPQGHKLKLQLPTKEIQDLLNSGYSIKAIAGKYKVDWSTINNRINKLGLIKPV